MKTLKLLKAELVKLFSKKSTYVLIAAVIIITVGALLFIKLESSLYEDYDTFYENYQIENYTNILEQNKNENNKLLTKICEEEINLLKNKVKDLKEVNEQKATWKTDILYNYYNLKENIIVANLLNEGYTNSEINTVLSDKFIELNVDEEIFNMSKTQLEEYLLYANNECNKYYRQYKESNYVEYIKERKVEVNQNITDNNESIKSIDKEILSLKNSKNITEDELLNLNKQKKYYTLANDSNAQLLKVYNYYIDNNIDAVYTNWKYTVLSDVENYIREVLDYKSSIYTESEYYKTDEYRYNKKDYDTYLKEMSSQINDMENKIKIAWYAIDNNIPTGIYDAKESAKDTASVSIVGIVVILIAGATVSHEFSTGTIRFLLTRPVKRYKVLLSKILMVIVITIMLLCIMFLTCIITSGLVYSFSNLFVPELSIKNNEVIETCFMLDLLIELIIKLVPSMLFIAFAFALSTVFKSTALSIGLGLGGWFAGTLANGIFMSYALESNLLKDYAWIKYTPLPYLDMSYFLDKNYLDVLKNFGINMTTALLVPLAYIVIFTVVSFIVFVKQDIKNQ